MRPPRSRRFRKQTIFRHFQNSLSVSHKLREALVHSHAVQGIFEAELSEVHYKADPAHLLEPIEIDLAALPQTTKTMYVKDLKLEEKGVHVTTSGEQQLFHIGAYGQEETDEDEAADETK